MIVSKQISRTLAFVGFLTIATTPAWADEKAEPVRQFQRKDHAIRQSDKQSRVAVVIREKFGEMKVFMNPELVGADSPEEFRRRAVRLVRNILKEAEVLGMETGISIAPVEWPKEFMKVLPADPKQTKGASTMKDYHAMNVNRQVPWILAFAGLLVLVYIPNSTGSF